MQLTFDTDNQGIVTVYFAGKVTPAKLGPGDVLVDNLGAEVYAQRGLFDLSGSNYIDSRGISWLLVCHQRFKEHGGRLVLYGLPQLVMNVMLVVKMDKVFEIAATREEAIRRVKGELDPPPAPPAPTIEYPPQPAEEDTTE